MKKVLFCILLCISLVVSYAQETKRLYIQNLSVKNTKKNGKSWDFGGVQKGAPDILIQIYIKKMLPGKCASKVKHSKIHIPFQGCLIPELILKIEHI